MAVHHQWIDAKLVGGPHDGHTTLVRRGRRLVMARDKPQEMEEHRVSHAYIARGDDENHFDYIGQHSMHEINTLIRGGEIQPPEPDDCGDADWWKK